MSSLFQQEGLQQMVDRINRLTPDTQRQWGKMDVAQMVAHIRLPLEVGMGKIELPDMFIMKLIGPMIRKSIFSDKPTKKNSPTADILRITGPRDFNTEKTALLQTLNDFIAQGNQGKLVEKHKYFGKMNTEEWGTFQRRHLDHHLSQFGV